LPARARRARRHARSEAFELHEVRRQRGGEIDLAFDRVHRIVFTPITRVGHRIRSSSGNMSKLSLWPPGLANQCSATSGRLIAHAFRALDIEEQPHPVPVTYMNEAPSICDPSVGLDGLS